MSSPLSFSHTLPLHRTAYMHCSLLPVSLTDTISFMTPLAAGIVACTHFGLGALGTIDEPFDTRPSDLPLAATYRTIESN